jgi:lipoprotein-releasing system permease protein
MKNYLDRFNPDVKIIPKEGKYFIKDDLDLVSIEDISYVQSVSFVLEEVALLEYRDKQQIGILKGVDNQYLQTTSISDAIVQGDVDFDKTTSLTPVTVGSGIYNNLNISLDNEINALKIYVPNRNKRGPLDKEFNLRSSKVTGVFSIQNERDNQYVLSNYDFIADVLDLQGYASALEIQTLNGSQSADLFTSIRKAAGPDFEVQSRYQQDESFLQIMNIEKWSSYLIFGFTLILIIFNVIGCLWMIVLDKKKDISILQAMGITKKRIKFLFLTEGGLISVLGFSIGLVFALLFYALQNSVGIIHVPDGFSITSYPMEMRWFDVVVVLVTVLLLGFLASIPAANRASRITAYVRAE